MYYSVLKDTEIFWSDQQDKIQVELLQIFQNDILYKFRNKEKLALFTFMQNF